MDRTEDPVADRAAQLEAAYSAYSVGLDAIHAEHKRAVDMAAERQREGEAELFESYRKRVERVTGEPTGTVAAAERAAAARIGAEQEQADIEESGM